MIKFNVFAKQKCLMYNHKIIMHFYKMNVILSMRFHASAP